MVVPAVGYRVLRPAAGRSPARPGGFCWPVLVVLRDQRKLIIAKRGSCKTLGPLRNRKERRHALGGMRAYVKRFHVAESDLYHVTLGLTWFEDAEAEAVRPKGMTDKTGGPSGVTEEEQAPPLVLSLGR